jgi:hypothetical protein
VFRGEPIEVRYSDGLRDTAGHPAHAATFIRRRLIILDSDLKRSPSEHSRILCHELFHFAWVRLDNSRRLSWEQLLRAELRVRATGEAGWSAEWRKGELCATDLTHRTRRWREYCCESFCDTAAWLRTSQRSELTLARPQCDGRKRWFARHIDLKELAL